MPETTEADEVAGQIEHLERLLVEAEQRRANYSARGCVELAAAWEQEAMRRRQDLLSLRSRLKALEEPCTTRS